MLKNKIIIISGIGPGLGIKMAIRAAEEGAKGIVLSARTLSKLDDAEEAVKKLGLGTEVLKVQNDISNRAQCEDLVQKTISRFGKIDALINSAYSHSDFETAEHAELKNWRQDLEVNLLGTMNMTLAVVPQMKSQGYGSVVMVNTMAARHVYPPEAGYAVSKGALRTAAMYLAEDLGKYGIRVNSAFMGWMWGAPLKGYFEQQARENGISVESAKEEVAKSIALRRIPEDAECANAAIFLASDYSSAMSGAQLDVNGGHFMPS